MTKHTTLSTGESKKYKSLDDVSEKEKLTPKHLKMQMDYTIRYCSDSPWPQGDYDINKAYRFRAGKRNASDYEYLTKRYGTELPAKLSHTPLIRSMIDAIVGLQREMPDTKQVMCIDHDSQDIITKNRRKAMLQELKIKLSEVAAKNSEMAQGAPPEAKPEPIELSPSELKQMTRFYERDWKDDLEINGSHMLYSMSQRLKTKETESELMENLATSGQGYYQCKVERLGQPPLTRALDPRQVKYRKSKYHKYLRDHERVVLEFDMTVTDVVNRWGHQLKQEDLEKIYEYGGVVGDRDIRSPRLIESENGYHFISSTNTLRVKYVEWLSNNKIYFDDFGKELTEEEASVIIQSNEKAVNWRYRKDRYEGWLLLQDIYVGMGMSKYIQRSSMEPWNCHLTVNGAIYDNGEGVPRSMTLETQDLQDKYDSLFMHWENMVALSGVKAIMVDFADMPQWMGATDSDRAMKWLGYLKQGLAIVDRSDNNPVKGNFSQMGEVDLTLSNSVSTILEMLRFIEETAARIAGVPRQMVGQITQYDGKATAEMAQAGGSIVTKPLFALHADICRQMYTDLVNNCRIAFHKGYRGSYIMNANERKTFTVDADKFTLADYDTFIMDGMVEKQQLEGMKQLSMEFVKQQMVGAEVALDTQVMRSVAELRERMREAIADQKAEQKENLQGQLEQAMKQVQDLTKQVEANQQAEMQVEQGKLQILQQDSETKAKEARDKDSYNNSLLELKKEELKLEGMQITYNKQSLEVNNKV